MATAATTPAAATEAAEAATEAAEAATGAAEVAAVEVAAAVAAVEAAGGGGSSLADGAIDIARGSDTAPAMSLFRGEAAFVCPMISNRTRAHRPSFALRRNRTISLIVHPTA
jgi:hypothetical protein